MKEELKTLIKCLDVAREKRVLEIFDALQGDEAERLLRLSCEHACGEHVEDNSLEALRKGRSPELGDMSLAIESACNRLRKERDELTQWRVDVTAQLLKKGGCFYEDVSAEVRALREERDSWRDSHARIVAEARSKHDDLEKRAIASVDDQQKQIVALTNRLEEANETIRSMRVQLDFDPIIPWMQKVAEYGCEEKEGTCQKWIDEGILTLDEICPPCAFKAWLVPEKIPEPSEDLKAAVERRFKSIMRRVFAFGGSKKHGDEATAEGQLVFIEEEVRKLVESGLKFAGEGPLRFARGGVVKDPGITFVGEKAPCEVIPLPASMHSSAKDNAPIQDLTEARKFDLQRAERKRRIRLGMETPEGISGYDEQCPDCKGSGVESDDRGDVNAPPCSLCDGKGFVSVGQAERVVVPIKFPSGNWPVCCNKEMTLNDTSKGKFYGCQCGRVVDSEGREEEDR